MEEKEKEKDFFNGFVAFVKKDFIVIIICLLVLLGCMFTLYNVESYKDKCNTYWNNFYNDCQCQCTKPAIDFNKSFKLVVPIAEEIKNDIQNSS